MIGFVSFMFFFESVNLLSVLQKRNLLKTTVKWDCANTLDCQIRVNSVPSCVSVFPSVGPVWLLTFLTCLTPQVLSLESTAVLLPLTPMTDVLTWQANATFSTTHPTTLQISLISEITLSSEAMLSSFVSRPLVKTVWLMNSIIHPLCMTLWTAPPVHYCIPDSTHEILQHLVCTEWFQSPN